MAKCKKCGRKGFFLKLTDGLCDNCHSTAMMEEEQAKIQENINHLKVELADQQKLYDRIAQEAREKGISQAKEEERKISARAADLQKVVDEQSAKLNDVLEQK